MIEESKTSIISLRSFPIRNPMVHFQIVEIYGFLFVVV